MPRFTVDPTTGEKTKVSGTNYVAPCCAKTEARKEAVKKPETDTETVKDFFPTKAKQES